MADNMPRPSGSSGREATNAEREDKMRSGAGFREVVQTVVSAIFPVERAELEEQVGDERVEIEKGRTVSVREIIRILPSERFETDVEFRQALEENWEEVKGLPTEAVERETKKAAPKRASTKRKTTTKRKVGRRAPKVNRGRTTNRNAGTKGSNRSAVKRKGNRGGNERAGGKSGNQRPGGRSRQQRGSKTQRAQRQRKQAIGARNKRTRGRRTGAVPGRSRSR